MPRCSPVLDVACGGGRHSRFFAQRGHPVTAIDRDISKVNTIQGVQAIRADLEAGLPWPLSGQRFGAVVVTNYLHRPLFSVLVESLQADGVLLMETFALGNERFGRPSNPDFLLQPNELLAQVALAHGLTVVAYEFGVEHGDTSAVRQRLCALKGHDPIPELAPKKT